VTQGTVEYWQQLVSHVVLNRELGIEFDSLAPRGVVLRLRYSPAIAESDDAPRAHTGAIAAMVDACLGFSVHWALPDDRSLATLNMRIDHLSPPSECRDVYCRATCHRLEQHVGFARGEIYHDDPEQPFALAVASVMFITADSWITRLEKST
jgi:acyl-coenzyme A thioesterase PaaI-like protein